MSKILINSQSQIQTSIKSEGGIKSDSLKLMEVEGKENVPTRKELRMPRTAMYINAIRNADKVSEQNMKMIEAVKKLPMSDELLVIVGRCYLDGCKYHTVNNQGQIVEHYENLVGADINVRQGYDTLVSDDECEFVEVYMDEMCMIYDDGSTKVVKR